MGTHSQAYSNERKRDVTVGVSAASKANSLSPPCQPYYNTRVFVLPLAQNYAYIRVLRTHFIQKEVESRISSLLLSTCSLFLF